MEPLEYLRIVRQRWWLIALTLVIAAVAVWWTTPAAPEVPQQAGPRTQTYTATHTLYQEPAANSRSGTSQLDTMAVLATRGDIPSRVVQRLALDIEPAVLARDVTVTANSRQGTLTVSVIHADGDYAADVANAFAAETVAYFEEQVERRDEEAIVRISEQMVEQQDRLRQLDADLRALPEDSVEVEIIAAQRESLLRQFSLNVETLEQIETREPMSLGLYTLEDAVPVPNLDAGGFEPPTSRSGRMPIALGLAVLLGVGLALLSDRVDTRVRTRRGAEHAFGLPVITEVPKIGGPDRRRHSIVAASRPTSDVAEAYRILRLSLQLMPRWLLPSPVPATTGTDRDPGAAAATDQAAMISSEQPPRVLLVTSASLAQGKTVTVANLAASFAEAGKSVCVIDCDLRHPDLHRYLGTPDRPGVTDFLGDARDDIRHDAHRTELPGVWLVPGGTPVANPGEVLGPDQSLVEAAAQTADVVIIDSGPLLTVNDPATLLPQIDAVIVVARSGRTSGEAAYRTRQMLARLKAPILGVTLVGVPRSLVSRGAHFRRRSAPEPGIGRRRGASRTERVWPVAPVPRVGDED